MTVEEETVSVEMNAYEIMHEWDRASGREPRTNEQLDREVPGMLGIDDYEAWKERLEARHIPSIVQGLRAWGLPVGPLGGFEVDEAIETYDWPPQEATPESTGNGAGT